MSQEIAFIFIVGILESNWCGSRLTQIPTALARGAKAPLFHGAACGGGALSVQTKRKVKGSEQECPIPHKRRGLQPSEFVSPAIQIRTDSSRSLDASHVIREALQPSVAELSQYQAENDPGTL